MSYTLRKEEEEEEADGGEILGGTGYGRWDEYFCSLKVHRLVTQIQRRTVVLFISLECTKSEVTRFLNVPLDVSDVFLMTFMILLDSYMEPTRVGSIYKYELELYLHNLHVGLHINRSSLSRKVTYMYTWTVNLAPKNFCIRACL